LVSRWFWIEEHFKGSYSRCRVRYVQIGSPERLARLLMALTIALWWRMLAALPALGALPVGWGLPVAQWGRASLVRLALTLNLLDILHDLPLLWLATLLLGGGYASAAG
jgi:hypothetical protein